MLPGPILVNDIVFYIQIMKSYGKHILMIFIHHKGDTVMYYFYRDRRFNSKYKESTCALLFEYVIILTTLF